MESETSQKKIESNGRNARKSTGPKTPEGKRAVRFNALKHGILAKEVVIEAGSGKESRAKFTELLTQLRQELQPEGILEEMQVERIAACYWRLRRAQRAEVGEIRKDLDAALFRDQIELLGPGPSMTKGLRPSTRHPSRSYKPGTGYNHVSMSWRSPVKQRTPAMPSYGRDECHRV